MVLQWVVNYSSSGLDERFCREKVTYIDRTNIKDNILNPVCCLHAAEKIHV